jgi:hypothetical protein
MEGGARLRPVTVPPPLRLLLSALGGASELGSVSSLPFDGSGVELDSDALSTLSGGCTDGDGSGLMGVGDAGLTSAGKSASLSGDRRRTTILLFLLPFDADLLAVEAISADGVDGFVMI